MTEHTLWSRRKFIQWAGSSSAFGVISALTPWRPRAASKGRLAIKQARPGFAYVGSANNLAFDSSQQGILVFAIHDERWTLTQTIASSSPAFLALHPNQQFLYVLNAIDTYENLPTGAIEAYCIDPQNGHLTLLNRQPLSLSGIKPKHLAVSPDGRNVVVAIHGGGAYNLLPVRKDGHLERVSKIVKETGSGPHRKWQEAAHPQMVMFDTLGCHLLSSDLGSDRLNVFAYTDGELTIQHRRATTPGSGPSHLIMHPSGQLLYVMHELDASISCYGYDPVHGRVLERLHHVSMYPNGFRKPKAAGTFTMHPSGQFLYTASYQEQPDHPSGSITVWRIDPRNGALARMQHITGNIHSPSAITVTSDGANLFLLGKNNVHSMRIHPVSGHLSQPMQMANAPGPTSLALKYL